MNVSLPETELPAGLRSAALRAATHSTHDRIDTAIMAARPFDNVENYSRFLRVQYAFHRDVSPLYRDAKLAALIPDLISRSRVEQVAADAADLGALLPEKIEKSPATEGIELPEALGWLYVVEGSNLGAAFLFKAALKMGLSQDHGARHLAEAPEGRAAQWRGFKSALDAVVLTEAEEARCITGAEAAFARVRDLIGQYLQ
jgi:heme oxygenase